MKKVQQVWMKEKNWKKNSDWEQKKKIQNVWKIPSECGGKIRDEWEKKFQRNKKKNWEWINGQNIHPK